VLGQQIPDKLSECVENFTRVESFNRTDFDYEEDVALTADSGAELGIKDGFVFREVVQINNSTIDITEFNITNT
jgi:hypothetical protein